MNLSKFSSGTLSNGSIRSLWISSFFTLPVSSFQLASFKGKKRFANEPAEAHRAVVHHLASVARLPVLFSDFTFQCFPSF